jgi:hypothetical protein
MLEYVLMYLFAAAPCFFGAYCFGAEMNFRLDLKDSFPRHLLNGFRLLVHDYFRLHCPWSWKVAKEHRLNNMREYLGSDGTCHDQLGHITSADCDNPEKQERIARLAFVSRTRFWASGMFKFFVAPVMVVVGILAAIFLDMAAYLRICKNKA